MKNGTLEIDSYGNKRWYLNGKYHRLDGPAVIWHDSNKEWWVNGEYHRLDGPAVIGTNGYKKWYVNNIHYTEEEFTNMILTNWIWFFK